jgi:AcrR family transcriptional regulator
VGRRKLRTESLRTDMCAAALSLLEGGGAQAVTTRAVAGAAGSSVAAVDELFGGKPGLVRALHTEGFRLLAGTLAALPAAGSPRAADSLLDLTYAIRSFARAHGHLYEVMFSRPFAEFGPTPADRAAAETVYDAILARVVALLPARPHRPPGAGKDAAITLWACVHGLVTLERAGLLGSTAESADRRWRTAVTATIRGLAA